MARQKKSALTAATVQSTQGNLIRVNFSANRAKSQAQTNVNRLYATLKASGAGRTVDSIIAPAEASAEGKPLYSCPPNLKRVLQGTARCPESSVQMVRDILVRGRV